MKINNKNHENHEKEAVAGRMFRDPLPPQKNPPPPPQKKILI